MVPQSAPRRMDHLDEQLIFKTLMLMHLGKLTTLLLTFTKLDLFQATKKKTVFDCWNGYHSIPLHEDDQHLTSFISLWGRFRHKVAPQGYIASGDGYTCCLD